MAQTMDYPLTRQGVRDLDNPIQNAASAREAAERTACVLGGAMLAGLGLAKGGLPGLVVAAAGGAIAHCGVAGYCPAGYKTE
jgi:uncharacterized membrane protein